MLNIRFEIHTANSIYRCKNVAETIKKFNALKMLFPRGEKQIYKCDYVSQIKIPLTENQLIVQYVDFEKGA